MFIEVMKLLQNLYSDIQMSYTYNFLTACDNPAHQMETWLSSSYNITLQLLCNIEKNYHNNNIPEAVSPYGDTSDNQTWITITPTFTN